MNEKKQNKKNIESFLENVCSSTIKKFVNVLLVAGRMLPHEQRQQLVGQIEGYLTVTLD